MRFRHEGGDLAVEIDQLVIAGWTGRDPAAVRHHIRELAELGIAPPSRTPLFYRAGASLLTRADGIEVLGDATSGEVEPLVIRQGDAFWLGLASDHTDRGLEAVSVAASKQVCPKPVGRDLWPLDATSPTLDSLQLRCEALIDGGWTTYQDGALAAILPLRDLIAAADLPDRAAMLCGTLPAIGGVRPASAYRMEMRDPARDKALHLAYAVTCLPVID